MHAPRSVSLDEVTFAHRRMSCVLVQLTLRCCLTVSCMCPALHTICKKNPSILCRHQSCVDSLVPGTLCPVKHKCTFCRLIYSNDPQLQGTSVGVLCSRTYTPMCTAGRLCQHPSCRRASRVWQTLPAYNTHAHCYRVLIIFTHQSYMYCCTCVSQGRLHLQCQESCPLCIGGDLHQTAVLQ